MLLICNSCKSLKSLLVENLGPTKLLLLLLIVLVQFVFIPIPKAYATTTPDLGLSASFSILSGTYTNTAGGTTINGDLGYTTGPATVPTVNGATHAADTTYNQAGIDQGSALSTLATQPCTFTFAPGAIDLATDTTHGPIGVYTPGVYCSAASSAASIGAGGITLSGSGVYIFRVDGALTTAANSAVNLAGDASVCDVFWTPTSATTLGANSTFAGTDIDASGITIGSTVTWTGRALAFGGTVSTTTDTITTPTCESSPNQTPSPSSPPNPTSSSSSNTSSSNSNNPPCVSNGISTVPNITAINRVSPTSIFLAWGPNGGLNDFVIKYGFSNGNWQFSTHVSGFSTTINDLPANQPIWFEVAATDNCAVGTFSASMPSGGTRTTTPGFPNTGGPLLPNTGINPEGNNLWLSFGLIGLTVLTTLLLFKLIVKTRHR